MLANQGLAESIQAVKFVSVHLNRLDYEHSKSKMQYTSNAIYRSSVSQAWALGP